MTQETFLQELKKIIATLPKPPFIVQNCENCENCNNLYYSKNVINGFDSANCTDSAYIFDSYMCANCVDCDYGVESELCYDSVDLVKGYNCDFSDYCTNIRDSAYSHWCFNSNDLFGCVYLRNKSFCIFNRQLTEADYREKVKIYKTWPQEKVFAIVNELKKRYPITQTIGDHNENTQYGNYMHYNKNCYLCFDAAHDENCTYVYDTFYSKNCTDTTYSGQNVELAYENVSNAHVYNCNYSVWCKNCNDSWYLFACTGVKDSMGCVNLNNKQYCLLNRQLTKEDYERESQQLLSEIRSKNLGWSDIKY